MSGPRTRSRPLPLSDKWQLCVVEGTARGNIHGWESASPFHISWTFPGLKCAQRLLRWASAAEPNTVALTLASQGCAMWFPCHGGHGSGFNLGKLGPSQRRHRSIWSDADMSPHWTPTIRSCRRVRLILITVLFLSYPKTNFVGR